MSTRSRRTHRRDGDPVRVYADGRVAWWTGGRPGVGVRKAERKGAAADTLAEELRQLLRAGEGAAPRPHATLDEMAQAALDQMRRAGTPEGTVRQYKSNWNCWVPADVGGTRFADARVRTFLPLLVHRYARSDLRAVTYRARGAVPGRADADATVSQTSSAG